MNPSNRGLGPLAAGGLAAILASTCCLGPLVLITLGISGAWIANLTALEPYRPLFAALAVFALFLAWRRLWWPAADCRPGQMCVAPRVNRVYHVLFWLVVLLVAVALVYPFALPLFY